MTNRLIEIALATTLFAAAFGGLPRLQVSIQMAELQLLKATESTKWGHPFLLPTGNNSTVPDTTLRSHDHY